MSLVLDATTNSTLLNVTTMPSTHINVRNPMGRMHLPHPRPTVSLDPRPVVIPILSSVIGFPIVAFAIICGLRHRAMKLRRRDHLKKMQSGIRSVTLDLPPRDKISFFSGGSSPEVSLKEPTCADSTTSTLKPILRDNSLNCPSRNNNHVKFVTPAITLDASHTMKVDAVLHHIAAAAAECVVGAEVHPWTKSDDDDDEDDEDEELKMRVLENGIDLDSSRSESPR